MDVTQRLSVLLVSPTEPLAAILLSWLAALDVSVTLCSEFLEARGLLERHPDIIVTELKLGAYNGLHLALRSPGSGVVVLGEQDAMLQVEAEHLGATYLPPPFTRDRVMAVITGMLARRGGALTA